MVIDTHTHIGTMLNFDMREEHILYMMKEYSIDHCIVSNSECATHDHNQKEIPKKYRKSHVDTNLRAIKFARENMGKISAALWVNPHEDYTPIDEMIKDNRDVITAIKLHPFHANLRFDSELIKPYLALAQKYSLPIVTHTGNGECDDVKLVYNVAKNYPDVNFVMVHMGLGTDNNEAIDLISKLPNLYGDTTWVSIKSTLKFLEICGDDKIVFGSDAPIDGKDTYLDNGKGERSLYQAYFNEFRDMVSEDTYEKIMYKNAQKLFKI
ncbi:MAG: amidohydrolase [Ruminococcaceae bacterium]|nr:amidohydrolase [Oscillospiraceae bacterium]